MSIALHDFFHVQERSLIILTLVEKIRALARQRDLSLPQLEQELGLGNGTISRWRSSSPNTEKLQKIADYFQVSMDYLLGREQYLTQKDEKDIAKDLDNIMEKLTSGEDGPASYNGEEISPEAAELFRDELEIALKRLKLINKEKYTPKKYKK
nr:MAG TPA: repressor protein [Caudoviricetes sp.]